MLVNEGVKLTGRNNGRIFSRILVIMCLTALVVGGTASARIRAASDFNNSIAFSVDDRWTSREGTNLATLVKYVDSSEAEKYWFRVDSYYTYKSKQFIDVIINDKTISLSPIEDPNKEYLRCGYHKRGSQLETNFLLFHPAYTLVFDLSPENISLLSSAEKIAIVLKHDAKEPTVLSFSQEKVDEIKKIIKLKRSDFKDYIKN